MSGVLATAGVRVGRERLQRALGVMARRGAARPQTVVEDTFSVSCARHMWEFADHISGPVSVRDEGRCVLAADASLYYRGALVEAMTLGYAGPTVDRDTAPTPTDLIAATYRRWGEEGFRRLEGDFSFALFDRERRRLVAARDFAGFRPLYWAPLAGGVAVASSVGALLALGTPNDLDPVMLASVASGLHRGSGPETVYSHIQALRAGHTLTWSEESGIAVVAHWEPPRWGRSEVLPFDEAAERLRALLGDAIKERLAPQGTTSVPLSGGWDSTAVYAVGKALLSELDWPVRTAPISISYPEGDPGREDDLILASLGQWNDSTRWLDVDSIDLFSDLEEKVERLDLPFLHFYENWNRALAHGGVADGASVQFSGYGGDQLFQVSHVYIADLLRRGRLWAAWREWRLKGGTSRKEFLRWALVPNLPASALGAWASLRGGRLHQYLDRTIPTWFDPDFAVRHALREREEPRLPGYQPGSHAEREWRWFLLDPYFPMVGSRVADFCLETGLESRAPLYDRRIVEFCATRPATDLSWGKETKKLLRAATRGLVPDSVLAPRPHRTGVTSAYAARQFKARFPEILRRVCAEPFELADHGIIRADSFRRLCAPIIEDQRLPSFDQVQGIFYTVVTELWLRARKGAERS